ncbi:aspartyl aminopeptidase [Hathewaya proteolytica DSM 3090]|uniref:M18 family aminopeptidase n=1 Tax=Hathewaya proteolytica DSM 3090 TaxID=1121331 RepID=A0A1M6RT54_9CLOT|nr:M18 family aminopeptidase [Hathewaya proteolytica]SHK35639.1 aspartyl aminopeptidase [Hathewaya proteolytica DSM 3090]
MKSCEFAQNLIDFISESPTAFHATSSAEKLLAAAGFSEVKEEEKWELKKGGKYYLKKNDSAIVAFRVGKSEIEENGFRLIGAHTDSPTFRIKPASEIVVENSYVKLNTEPYGGLIYNTWMDRPLSIAGRVVLKSDDVFNPEKKFLNITRPIMIIPNMAIHMNRNINKGVELNPQNDLLPVLTLINENMEKQGYLLNLIADELKVNKEDIIDFDLYMYETEKGCIMGLNQEFISCSRLDDLQMVHAGIIALINSNDSHTTNVMICYDNEEIGSMTKQGADSELVPQILERICICLGKEREDYFRALGKSYLISADNAHAVHPANVAKHDPTNRPMINKGPVIKVSAKQKYTTDADSSAVYEMICKKAQVPYQKFVNRSDEPGGSTIGPISAAHLNIRSVDIGNPTLSMHSIREMAGVEDHLNVYKSFVEFYNI